MDLDEALKKYGIAVPTDEEFYSEEYIQYFNSEKKDGKFEKYRPFQEVYNRSFAATFYTSDEFKDKSMQDREAVVLGGQAGAGKSNLVIEAIREYADNDKKIFLIDDDLYRAFYPKVIK